MSIFDESFPSDVQQLCIIPSTNEYNKNANDFLLPSRENSDDDSKETTTNSGNSDEKLVNIDETCNTSTSPPKDYKIMLKKKSFMNQKSHSYQDLHSVYTKKKYQHVQSKVQQYIANIRAQDKRRKSKSKPVKYHGSLPETMNNGDFGSILTLLDKSSSEPVNVFLKTLENLNQNNMGKNNSIHLLGSTDINNEDETIKMMFEKDQQITELKEQNDYLQSNLDNKTALAARYKRNADLLQVELLQLKEREKQIKETNYSRYGYRSSLPTSYLLFSAGKVTASTQTDFLSEKIINDEYLNFSDTLDFFKANGNYNSIHKLDSIIIFNQDDVINNIGEVNNEPSSGNQLRRRSNSNSMKLPKNTKLMVQDENATSSSSLDARADSKNNGSDSAIETDELLQIEDSDVDEDDEESSIDIGRPFLKKIKCSRRPEITKNMRAESNGENLKKRKNRIKKRIAKKIFFKTLFGSCVKCCHQNSNCNSDDNDTISYKEVRLSHN